MEKVKKFFKEKMEKFVTFFEEKMRKYLKKLRDIKDDYLNRSPKGKWEFARNIGESILMLTGTHILDPNFKPRWYTYISVFVFCDFFVCFFYTTWYNWNDQIKRYVGVSVVGLAVPVSNSNF